MSRTYLKGTLEKLGLGFAEWRLFKYKSAAETFSRDSMSDYDREQSQAYTDDWYETRRDEIIQSRGMTIARYETLMNEHTLFSSAKALENGFVDKLDRWDSVDDIMDDALGKNIRPIDSDQIIANALPPKYWGGDPKITFNFYAHNT